MIRKKPKKPKKAETDGYNRLSVGYKGKYVKSIMYRDEHGNLRSEVEYIKGVDDSGSD